MSEEIGISKFKNIGGVTCYMNSILSILQQIDIFCDYIISGSFYINLTEKSKKNLSNTITYHLHKLFKISLEMNNGSLTPTSLRKTCSDKDFIWGNQEQQDSSEYFRFLINQVLEELGVDVLFVPGRSFKKIDDIKSSILNIQSVISHNKFLRKEYSPLTKLFVGLELTSTTCKICNNNNNSFETNIIWQLHIPYDNKNTSKDFQIEELMDKWSENEILDDKNKLKCEFCGVKSNASKSHLIMKTPKILVIQFMRFKRDMFGNIHRKITNKINYPVNNLNIKKYISKSSQDYNNCNYNLIGINCHYELGQSQNLNLGHYISIVKNRYDDNWWIFNDSNKPIKILKEDDLINKNAYLLFYYRTN